MNSRKAERKQQGVPGTVHLPFFNMVSTASAIRGWALATSSVCHDYGQNSHQHASYINTYGELVEWSSVLNVGKGGLQLLELDVNLLLGLLGLLDLEMKQCE